MNTVTALASIVGAYTYIRLYTHITLCYTCTMYIIYVRTSVESALVGPQNQHSNHITLSITQHKTYFIYVHLLKMGRFQPRLSNRGKTFIR
jgi:hypothetical protein